MVDIVKSGFIFNEQGKLDVNAMRTNGTLSHEDYIKWDAKMVDVARRRLNVVQDFATYGLVDNNYDLGDIVAKYEKLSNMSSADVSMDGVTAPERDRLVFTEAGVPIPIFHKEFQLGKRQILSSEKNPGRSLPTTQLSTTTKLVAEEIDKMFWNGVPLIVEDSTQIYGFTNHPNRITKSASSTWITSGDAIADVEDMLRLAYADNFFGPFVLYISKDRWATIQGDYSANKGDRTYKERIEAFSDIDSVRAGDGLDNGTCVLVQMTEENVELKVAQDFVNFEQPQTHIMQYDFGVMASMALCLKSTSEDKLGVVHTTGI